MAQRKFETVIQKSNKIKAGTELAVTITLLRPDCSFEAKDKRYGTIYHCTPIRFDSVMYETIHKKFYIHNDFTIKVIKQDDYSWTTLVVEVM